MLVIIVPYYKLAFFEETLKSLSIQTDKRFKVFIGDDASAEDCSSLIKKYQGKFDFVYHRFESNLGGISLTGQWERCIALSQEAEWLMILGDDDMLGDNVVEEFYKQKRMFQDEVNVVRYASVLLNEETQDSSSFFYHPVWERAEDSFFRRIEGETRSSLSEYVFSKKSYLKHKFNDFPLAWHSDDKAWLDFSENKPIYSINNSAVFVRNSVLNISGREDNLTQKEEAAVEFYGSIFTERLNYFSKEKRLRLIYRYECALRNTNKITFYNWCLFLKQYIKNYDSYAFKKFLKRSVKR